MVDEYSGYDIVTLTDKKCIVKVSEVLRIVMLYRIENLKFIVMLYRIENLKFIVVDYNRTSLPVQGGHSNLKSNFHDYSMTFP